MKFLKRILLFIPYVTIWGMSLCIYSICNNEGLRISFRFVYGNLFSIIFLILCLLIFFSFFIFKHFIFRKKKMVFSYILSIVLSVVWIFAVFQFDAYTTQNVEFSREIWDKYPQTRLVLFDNLIRETDLLNYTQNEIIELFGEPNNICNDEFIYYDNQGNGIYIKFSNGVVCDRYLIS